MGYPGVLPVINEQAIDSIIMTALALHCEIPEFRKFDRKNYGYPDLPKGYQISQYDRPISRNGYLLLRIDGEQQAHWYHPRPHGRGYWAVVHHR